MRRFPFISARAAGREATEDGASPPALLRGACDCHVHLFGAPHRYPLAATRAYTPGVAEVADAQALLHALGLERLVLVQPSAYGFDNACLLDGLVSLGDRARGVAVVRPDAADTELADLHAAGVRGLRINLGGSKEEFSGTDLVRDLGDHAARLAGTGWLIQIHAPAAALLEASGALLRARAPVVIDHFANIPAAAMPEHPACRLVEAFLANTETYLKLSAPYRVARSEEDLARLRDWIAALAARWPGHLLWGSDWPHTPPHGRHVDPQYSVGFQEVDAKADLSDLLSWIDDIDIREKVLGRNPETLYGFPEAPATA